MISIKFDFPKVAKKAKDRRDELERFLAAMIQTNRGFMFDQEGAHNGHEKWTPLKWRSGQILSKRGTLRKSLAPLIPDGKAGPGGIVRFNGGVVEVGTTLAYAAMMNFGTANLPGGKLVPKAAKALKLPFPEGETGKKGQKFMFRKSVKIPARRFDQWNAQDQDEVDVALANKVLEMAFE